MQSLKLYAWPALAGLLAALLILDRWVLPQQRAGTAVEVVSYAEAVRRATPAVVNIYTAKLVTSRPNPMLENSFFRRFVQPGQQPQRQRIEQSLGSGVIVSDQGHILTNNHVIAGADAIQVLLHDG
ncbi:MAG: protease, partial [Halieaceae bacterium]|nr:protease [Halieaceae bacterium]